MSDSFENLLARTEHREATPAGSCPDADVLAAYLDATLTVPERAGVEAHAADCARCALQLATLVRLEDVSGTPAVCARAPLVVTAGMDGSSSHGSPGCAQSMSPFRRVMCHEAPARPRTATLDDRPERKETEAAQAPAVRDFLAARRPPVPPMSMPAPVAKSVPSATPAPAPVPMPDAFTAQNQASDVAPRDQAASQDARITAGQFARKTETQAPASAPPSAAVVRESVAQPREEDVAMLGAPKRADDRLPLVVGSPDARVLWRVIEDRIQRTTDGGRTWLAERTPAVDSMTMGGAASSDVCWMAAASGQVLRRTEDGSWMDVSPAPRISIVRLDVTASLEATVVGTDGTAVKTSDGGRTWMR